MGLDTNIRGTTGIQAEVSPGGALNVRQETDAYGNGANVGAVRMFSEVDAGSLTGNVHLLPPEVDSDYRMRVSVDVILDEEVFNYTAQNTGKHNYLTTTLANSWTAGQLTTNSGSITTATTGSVFQTYATFQATGTQTLAFDAEVAFSAQPTTNSFIEWGIGIAGAQTAAPTDGVFFRLNAAGLQLITSVNGSETSSGVFPLAGGVGTWVYENNKRYQFIGYIAGIEAVAWVNDGSGAVTLGRIPLPSGNSRMMSGGGGAFFFKHRIVGGAASGVLQAYLGAYNVRIGGSNLTSTVSEQGNRVYGSYQGHSGGTMGSLALYANSANPTAAVPTNTTAALGVGLGGQFWETDTLAVTTDGIICSYQVPVLSPNYSGKRLAIRGVKIDSYVQTVLVGGGYVAQWSLCFGHTAVSLATADAATTKAPRRIGVGVQNVGSAAAVNTVLSSMWLDLTSAPVYVNPGEFVALAKKKVGTAPTGGVIAHLITFIYGFE